MRQAAGGDTQKSSESNSAPNLRSSKDMRTQGKFTAAVAAQLPDVGETKCLVSIKYKIMPYT